MLYQTLGSTGLKVSRLCYGTLTVGPLQKNLPLKDGGRLLLSAYDKGVNFFDAAELYGSYPYIKEAFSKNEDVIVTGRCYAYDAVTAEISLVKFLKETGRERADIFMLHEQESEFTLKGHTEAIEYFLRKKKEGFIGAFGISTHYVAAVKAALKHPEIEVLHPLINISGAGIADGAREDMEQAIKEAFRAGKGIYSMKSLGGGNLFNIRDDALSYIRGFPYIHSIAVGMRSEDEIGYNTEYFSMKDPSAMFDEGIKSQRRSIKIDESCILCGKCIDRCAQKALSSDGEKITADLKKCIFCGYCGAACSAFAIRIY